MRGSRTPRPPRSSCQHPLEAEGEPTSLGSVTDAGSLGCHVALFRGLNVGQAGSPTRDELLAAFPAAASAGSFQSNGTVLFRSDQPHVVARDARRALQRVGHHHELIVRPLAALASIADRAPAADSAQNVYRTMVSFFDVPVLPALPVPLLSRNELVELRLLEEGAAVSACWKRGSSAGDVTGFLEALLGVPVTTRTLGTCERLVAAGSV